MKYPCLVPESVCKTPVVLKIYREGISEDGEPLKAFEAEIFCNYQDKAHTVLTAEKQLVTLSGTALFHGDIFPEIANITGGEITVHGRTRRVYKGEKCRNPDGTVNYTRIEVV